MILFSLLPMGQSLAFSLLKELPSALGPTPLMPGPSEVLEDVQRMAREQGVSIPMLLSTLWVTETDANVLPHCSGGVSCLKGMF